MNKKQAIAHYAVAIKQAAKEALTEADAEDGGTCNLDHLVIDFKGWREKDIQEVARLSGIDIGDKYSYGIYKGCSSISIPINGQANRRTRMVEAAKRYLKEQGIEAYVVYMMD